MAKQQKTTTQPEPATVVLSDATRGEITQPTREELGEGQIAAEDGLAALERDLEDLSSLCRVLGANVNTPAVDLAVAFRVVASRIDDIRFKLCEESEAIVPLHNLAAWYHRAVSASSVEV